MEETTTMTLSVFNALNIIERSEAIDEVAENANVSVGPVYSCETGGWYILIDDEGEPTSRVSGHGLLDELVDSGVSFEYAAIEFVA